MKDPPTISIACTARAPTSQSHAASCKLLPKTFLPSFVIRETSSKSNRTNVVTDCFTDLRTKKQTPSFTRLRLKTSSLCYSFKITKQKYEATSSSAFWVNKRIVLGMSSWPEEWWFAHLKSFSKKWYLKSDFCSKFKFFVFALKWDAVASIGVAVVSIFQWVFELFHFF